ncbi:MAG TPA: hypothetical protein VMB52_02460 [Verrucomicrobiae bacterium]|nr:hypothetical protein [Verrucomicrobiae bacterium]
MHNQDPSNSQSTDAEQSPEYAATRALFDFIDGLPEYNSSWTTGLRNLGPHGAGAIDNPDLLPECVRSQLVPSRDQPPLRQPVRYSVTPYAKQQQDPHLARCLAKVHFSRTSALDAQGSERMRIVEYSVWAADDTMSPSFVDKSMYDCVVASDGQVTHIDPESMDKKVAAFEAGVAIVLPEETADVTDFLVDYANTTSTPVPA